MDQKRDYEADNLCISMQGDPYKLDEQLWFKYLDSTQRGPYSIESELHFLLQSAYQRIKLLERENKHFIREQHPTVIKTTNSLVNIDKNAV